VSQQTRILWGALGLLCIGVVVLAGRHLDEPGLYYDEVIQATPASEFLREGGRPLSVPGARSTWIFGGWFPLMTQPYMGALKSQLLIPTFALFGPSRETLRLATLAWGLVGLGLCALWIREIYGLPTALLTATLLAFDPSFVFATRHDWGSVSLALVCRGAALLLLTRGWRQASRLRLAAGGLCLGLGVYNKIDFLPFIAGAALALAAVAPRGLMREIASRRGDALAAAGGALLGAAPMLATLPGVLQATQGMVRSVEVRHSDLAEKLATWHTMLDGSHFHRLMLSGGSYERLMETDAAAGPFLVLCLAAAVGLGVALLREARRGAPQRAQAFALATAVFTALLLLATPRAARIHHTLNVYPFPQLVVALAAVRLWRAGGGRVTWRALAAAGVATTLLGSLRIDARILQTLHETGGRGRWSAALEGFARKLDPETTVVSLDWGFHAPLRFLRPELQLEEPVWGMPAAARRGPGTVLRGASRHVYLVQESGYEVYPIGGQLLEATRRLPMGAAAIQEHTDRLGETAFRSIRFTRPHELVYRGRFEVRLR
jgi:hypothetical protein